MEDKELIRTLASVRNHLETALEESNRINFPEMSCILYGVLGSMGAGDLNNLMEVIGNYAEELAGLLIASEQEKYTS